jgi:hypothetical protein
MKLSQKYRTILFHTCSGLSVGLAVSLLQKHYGPLRLPTLLAIVCIGSLLIGIGKTVVTLVCNKSRTQ